MTVGNVTENHTAIHPVVAITVAPNDDRTEEYSVQIDPSSGRRPSTAVVEAIASITNTDPTELDPLADHIDPDHLDELFVSPSSSERRDVSLSFSYGGYRVVVSEVKRIARDT